MTNSSTTQHLPPQVAPFSKSGGLADVCDKLGLALARMGHRVMTVSPLYAKNYKDVRPTGVRRNFRALCLVPCGLWWEMGCDSFVLGCVLCLVSCVLCLVSCVFVSCTLFVVS